MTLIVDPTYPPLLQKAAGAVVKTVSSASCRTVPPPSEVFRCAPLGQDLALGEVIYGNPGRGKPFGRVEHCFPADKGIQHQGDQAPSWSLAMRPSGFPR